MTSEIFARTLPAGRAVLQEPAAEPGLGGLTGPFSAKVISPGAFSAERCQPTDMALVAR